MKKLLSIVIAGVLTLMPLSAYADEQPTGQSQTIISSSSEPGGAVVNSDHYTYKYEITAVDKNYLVSKGDEEEIGDDYITYNGQIVSASKTYTYTSSYSGSLVGNITVANLSAAVGYTVGKSESVTNSITSPSTLTSGQRVLTYARPIYTKAKVTITKTTYVNGAVFATEKSYIYTTKITGVSLRQEIK